LPRNLRMLIPPEMFESYKQEILEIIHWASATSGENSSKEFNELLSGYLAAAHFSFIEAETKIHHTLSAMTGSLTNRQIEILRLIITGITNKKIAGLIHVSEATVHHEVTKILKSFSVMNRGELIIYFDELTKAEKAKSA